MGLIMIVDGIIIISLQSSARIICQVNNKWLCCDIDK